MSDKLKLNWVDGKKVLKGLAIAVVGAILTYGTNTLPNVELGMWTPMVMAGWSVVVNLVRKFVFVQE